MAVTTNVKSKRLRRKLLKDQLTLAEALKYSRGVERADQHATRVENQTTTEVTVKQEINKTTVDKSREKLCVGNIGYTKVDKENARLLENSVRDVAKETILQSVAKTSKKLN